MIGDELPSRTEKRMGDRCDRRPWAKGALIRSWHAGQWTAWVVVLDVARHGADENVPYDYHGEDAQVLWGAFSFELMEFQLHIPVLSSS